MGTGTVESNTPRAVQVATPSLEPKRARFSMRRAGFGLLVWITVTLLSWRVFAFLRLNGLTLVEIAILALFVVLIVPISISLWTALVGFAVHWRGRDDALGLPAQPGNELTKALPLTAIVLPVYNEDPARVMAGLKATYQSLERTGLLSHFEFFILSDTTDPDVWVREELAFVETRREVIEPGRIFTATGART
jgi:membrane glycosyltransferase